MSAVARRARSRWIVWCAAVAFAGAGVNNAARAATPAEIDKAIKKGIEFLYSQQDESGSWDSILKPDANGKFPGDTKQTSGPTSLAVYALLTAGESPKDEHIQKALEFMKKPANQPGGTYAIGFHANALAAMPLTDETKRLIAADSNWIKQAMRFSKDKAIRGFYGYGSSPKSGLDRSTSQCAVLGAWGCSQIGLNPGSDYWTAIEKAWRDNQLDDGGWNYSQGYEAQSSMSMTAAGVATLFITQEYLHGTDYTECKGSAADAHIDKGLKYLGEHFSEFDKKWAFYTLYGIERCGAVSGYRTFGEHDWFAEGADWLVKHQAENGSWEGTNNPSTSFALLFLGRGRAPVAVNKLQYGPDDLGDSSPAANWNQRPLDVLNVLRWTGKQQERQLNFQIVDVKSPVDALEDAPVLYISGNQPLKFSEEKVAKLKQFVEEGGLIVGNADCSNKGFAASFKALSKALFPAYEMAPLPTDHLILSGEQYPASAWKNKPDLQAVSNGARVLMMLYNTGDPAKYWQLHMVSGREEFHQSMADVIAYANGKDVQPRYKGESYIVRPDAGVQDERQMKVARIQYAGNWDPELGSWRRMGAILHNEQKVGLLAEPVTLGEGKLDPNAYRLAHLTGTTAVKLDDKAQAELKQYVENGGTLLVDACGGSTAFTADAEPMIAKIFGQKDSLPVLPPNAPLYATDFMSEPKITEVGYRPFARKVVGNETKTPLLRGFDVKGRTAVFFSREDLSVGMVGDPVDGITGYTPKSAKEIVQHLLISLAPAKPAEAKPAEEKK